MPIERGKIYFAPPDHHVLIGPRHMHVIRGTKENSFRPAIGAMFCTAAHLRGPRAVAIILTGTLDDSTVDMLAVKRRGSTTAVQKREEAAYPSKPRSVRRCPD